MGREKTGSTKSSARKTTKEVRKYNEEEEGRENE